MENEKQRIVDMPGVYLKNDENEIEYKIVTLEENKGTKLFLCAVGEQWTDHVKNTVLFKITDTGNGIKIGKKNYESVKESKTEDGILYHDAEYLRILLNFNNSISHRPSSYLVLLESEVAI